MDKREKCMAAYEELREAVLKLIAQNRVEEALDKLDEFAKEFYFDVIRKDLAIIAGRHNSAKQADSIYGVVTHAEADIAANTVKKGIVYEILEKIEQTCKQVVEKSQKVNKLTLNSVYFCNRTKQSKTFHNCKQSGKVRSFLIHGEAAHGHEAIFMRFYHDLCKKQSKTIQITLPGTISASFFKKQLLIQFLEQLGIDIDKQYEGEQILSETLAEALPKSTWLKGVSPNTPIFIEIKIPCTNQFPEIIEHLKWFNNVFCNAKPLAHHAPVFYFFFSIEYQTADWRQVFRANKLKKQKQKMLNLLQQSSSFKIIDELDWVKYEDIDKWLAYHTDFKTPTERRELIKNKFEEAHSFSRGYYMHKLVPSFKKIIDKRINSRS